MTDHATLNADILAAAKEAMRSALERQDWRGVNVLEKWVHSQERQGQEACKLLWQRAMDLAFNLGEAEGAAGRELADAPALLQLVPVLMGAWQSGWNFLPAFHPEGHDTPRGLFVCAACALCFPAIEA